MPGSMPSIQIPFLDPETGAPNHQWVLYLNSLSERAPAKADVTVTASPFSVMASRSGNFLVSGGTISNIQIVRGRDTIATGLTSGFIPVSGLDVLVVSYTVAPTIMFLPTGA